MKTSWNGQKGNQLREGCREKNPEKVWSFAKPGGEGVSEIKNKNQNSSLQMCFFSEHAESF